MNILIIWWWFVLGVNSQHPLNRAMSRFFQFFPLPVIPRIQPLPVRRINRFRRGRSKFFFKEKRKIVFNFTHATIQLITVCLLYRQIPHLKMIFTSFFLQGFKKMQYIQAKPFFGHKLNGTANPAHLAALFLPFWLCPQKGLI